MVPYAVAMSFELAVYSFMTAVLCSLLSPKRLSVYITAAAVMFAGRVVWKIVFALQIDMAFNLSAWVMVVLGGFLLTVINVIVRMILLPFAIIVLERTRFIPLILEGGQY